MKEEIEVLIGMAEELGAKGNEINFMKVLKEFNVKKCFYGHLHADSHKDAIEGEINGIDFKLISSDYLEFDLIKIL